MKIILYHPESGSYMYCHSEDERDAILADSDEIMDVTGDVSHEFQAEEHLGPFNPDGNWDTSRALLNLGGKGE